MRRDVSASARSLFRSPVAYMRIPIPVHGPVPFSVHPCPRPVARCPSPPFATLQPPSTPVSPLQPSSPIPIPLPNRISAERIKIIFTRYRSLRYTGERVPSLSLSLSFFYSPSHPLFFFVSLETRLSDEIFRATFARQTFCLNSIKPDRRARARSFECSAILFGIVVSLGFSICIRSSHV